MFCLLTQTLLILAPKALGFDVLALATTF